MKYVLILGLITLVAIAAGSPSCLGCVKQRQGADLKKSEEVLKKALNKLTASGGSSYEIVKINSASVQLTAGKKEIIDADIMDKNNEKLYNCIAEIVHKPLLQNDFGVKFQFREL